MFITLIIGLIDFLFRYWLYLTRTNTKKEWHLVYEGSLRMRNNGDATRT